MKSLREIFEQETAKQAKSIETGFHSLDTFLNVYETGQELVVLAGCPRVGKSSLALNIARAVAGNGRTVGIFSLQHRQEDIILRMNALEAKTDIHRIQLGLVSLAEEVALQHAATFLPTLPIYLDDSPDQTVAQIRDKARQMNSSSGLDLLIIDSLQLVKGNQYIDDRFEEMEEVSRVLKSMSRELGVSVIVCSDAKCAIGRRDGNKPDVDDLHDSGSIEYIADVVAFLHRDDLCQTEKNSSQVRQESCTPKEVEIAVVKDRHGPERHFKMYFDARTMAFSEDGVIAAD